MIRLKYRLVVVVALTLALGACGGGGGESGGSSDLGGNSNPPTIVDPISVGGLWAADYVAANGTNVSSRFLVTEDGRYFGIGRNLTTNCVSLGYGTLVTNGTSISGSLIAELASYSEDGSVPGCTFSDGTTSGKGVLSGSFVPRTSLTITSSGTTSSGMPLGVDTQTWRYDRLYELPSSLPSIAGAWSTSVGSMIVIGSDGVLSGTDPGTGCQITGQVSVVDPRYNAYTATGTVSGCHFDARALNGASVRALMMIDNTSSPTRLIVGEQTTTSNGIQIVAVTTSTR